MLSSSPFCFLYSSMSFSDASSERIYDALSPMDISSAKNTNADTMSIVASIENKDFNTIFKLTTLPSLHSKRKIHLGISHLQVLFWPHRLLCSALELRQEHFAKNPFGPQTTNLMPLQCSLNG